MAKRSLIHFNGADASTTIVDEIGTYTWACVGNAQLDTAQQKFGSAALLSDGTGDYIESTDITALPASGGWTIEFWVRFNSLAAFQSLFSYFKSVDLGGIWIEWNITGTRLRYNLSSNGTTNNISANGAGTKTSWNTGQWYHIAIVRDDAAGAYYAYVDGVLDFTVVSASQITNTLNRCRMGASVSAGFSLNGWIDEFVIWDTCVYPGGTTFTPSSSEYAIGPAVAITDGGGGDGTVTVTKTALVVVSDDGGGGGTARAPIRVAITDDGGGDGIAATHKTAFVALTEAAGGGDGVVLHTKHYRGAFEHECTVGYAANGVEHEATVGYGMATEHDVVYALMAPGAAEHEVAYALLTAGSKEHDALYSLLATNPGATEHEMRWSLLEAFVDVSSGKPFLEWHGEQLDIVAAEAAQDEGGQFWRVSATLARVSDYLRLSRLDAVTLDIFGDRYELVISSLGRSSSDESVNQGFELQARSTLWAALGDPGERITRTWPAVNARAAIEDLAGEAVDWRIVDWQIPAGRLAAVNETAISVIERIAGTAKGVVESSKDGGLIVRYLYPVPIPEAEGATPDVELTEAADILSIEETIDTRQVVNRVALTDASAQRGFLSAERDTDQPDQILAGESQRFIAYHSADIEIDQIKLSAGTLIDQGAAEIEITDEEITFDDTDTAQLAKPAAGGFTYTWIGTGLGALTLGADGQRLVAAQSGAAIALVSYRARAHRYAVLSPTSAGGRLQFPILAVVIGALIEDERPAGSSPLRIVVVRGAGDVQGDDIVAELAGTENVLFVRGRNEMDAAALKARATVQARYPADVTDPSHVMNGYLALVVDTQIAKAWRGKVVNIQHRIDTDDDGAVTVGSTLDMERFL